jgi:hypothetical protein
MTKIILELPRDEAMALAQMVKRFTYEDAARFANPLMADASGMRS